MPNMKRWSDEKLEKELMFAHACLDDSAETMAWLSALEREQHRRTVQPTESGASMKFTADQVMQGFEYWFKTSGHWIYRDRAHALATWKERGIEGLPDYPRQAGYEDLPNFAGAS